MKKLLVLLSIIANTSYADDYEIKIAPDGTFYSSGSLRKTYHYDPNVWNLGKCEKDKFNGIKSCEVSKDRLMISVLDGDKRVVIIGADYKNKESAIKVDENKTFYGIEGGFSNNSTIINQLLQGKTAYIRYVKWPYNYNIDAEIDLTGLKAAYEDMLKEYAKLK